MRYVVSITIWHIIWLKFYLVSRGMRYVRVLIVYTLFRGDEICRKLEECHEAWDMPRREGFVSPCLSRGDEISENLTLVQYLPSTSGPCMSISGNMWYFASVTAVGVIEHEVCVAIEVRIRRNESILTRWRAKHTRWRSASGFTS